MPLVPLLAALVLAGQSMPPTPASKAPAATPSVDEAGHRAVVVAAAAGMAGEIVVSDAGGFTFNAALGLADREHARPHRPGQQWIWGSVTKQVAATIAMQEVERGRLSLDAPVGRYLPAFAGNRAITVRQLLQHRSGLPDPDATSTAGGVPAFYRATGAGVGDQAAAQGYCGGPAVHDPGGDFHYNNCDYLVLGAVLHAVTGQSFGELVRARITRPLKLRSIRLAADGTPAGGAAATGYLGKARYPAINVATFGTAGALTGTARDLAALDHALLAGQLLTQASRAVLWAGDPKLGYQALGVWSYSAPLTGCAAPVRLVERRGDVGGTQVRNVIAPDLNRAVVVFTNDAALDFGEVWQGKGFTHDLLAAAFCPPNASI